MQTAIGGMISDAINPIYWVILVMTVIGFGFALILKEVPLQGRGPQRAD
jgi:hypothetical protein